MSSDVYAVCWKCEEEGTEVIGIYTSLEAAQKKLMALALQCDNVEMLKNGKAFLTVEEGEENYYYIEETILYT